MLIVKVLTFLSGFGGGMCSHKHSYAWIADACNSACWCQPGWFYALLLQDIHKSPTLAFPTETQKASFNLYQKKNVVSRQVLISFWSCRYTFKRLLDTTWNDHHSPDCDTIPLSLSTAQGTAVPSITSQSFSLQLVTAFVTAHPISMFYFSIQINEKIQSQGL